ncbi:MAG: tetratricopeptide repeat protein [Bdellovibrionales bacterium]|nr:tetratricopeptide repeat protein [Bdellovibrionales bacterium]
MTTRADRHFQPQTTLRQSVARRALLFGGALLILGISGCSLYNEEEPKTTDVAAATGAAVGAGLGAIIGSQTGDALGGTAIGAVAGAGAGYAVGTAIEDREQRAAHQEEAIRRQEETLKVQQKELNELRNSSGDTVAFRSNSLGASSSSTRASYGSGADYRRGNKHYVDPASLNNPFGNNPQRSYTNTSVGTSAVASPEHRDLRIASRAVPPVAERSITDYPTAMPGSSGGSGATSYSSSYGSNSDVRSYGANSAGDVQHRGVRQASRSQVIASHAAPKAMIPQIEDTSPSRFEERSPVAANSGEDVFAVARAKSPSPVRSAENSQRIAEKNVDAIEDEIEMGIEAVSNSESPGIAVEREALDAGEEQVVAKLVKPTEVAGADLSAGEAPVNSQSVSTVDSGSVGQSAETAKLISASDDCKKASAEAGRGASAESTADKLFYFRRALRLCPSAPEWHVELGKVYGSLGRYDDAKFEYEEALRIRPEFSAAQSGLDSLKQQLY